PICLDPRGNRNGKGIACQGDSQSERSTSRTVRKNKLCGDSRGTAGKRILQARKRGVQQSGRTTPGSIATGTRGHALLGRNRRPASATPAETAACPTRAGIREAGKRP